MISAERQAHLAHILTEAIWKDDLVDFSDDDAALKVAKAGISKFVVESKEIESLVTNRVKSLNKGITEGSPEWTKFFDKFLAEEILQRGQKS